MFRNIVRVESHIIFLHCIVAYNSMVYGSACVFDSSVSPLDGMGCFCLWCLFTSWLIQLIVLIGLIRS